MSAAGVADGVVGAAAPGDALVGALVAARVGAPVGALVDRLAGALNCAVAGRAPAIAIANTNNTRCSTPF